MITVVTGPPCSGKSTYCEQRWQPGDIVVDMDKIALAVTTPGTQSHDYDEKVRIVAREARRAAVKATLAVAQGDRYRGYWIIHTDPSPDVRASYRAMNARIIDLDPGRDVCLERLKQRPEANQALARKVIEEFYARR